MNQREAFVIRLDAILDDLDEDGKECFLQYALDHIVPTLRGKQAAQAAQPVLAQYLQEQSAKDMKPFIDAFAAQTLEPVAWVVDGGKKNGRLLYAHEYEFELVAPKIMCKPLYTTPPNHVDAMRSALAALDIAESRCELQGDKYPEGNTWHLLSDQISAASNQLRVALNE